MKKGVWLGFLLLSACQKAPLPGTVQFPPTHCERLQCWSQLGSQRIILQFQDPPGPLKPFAFTVELQGIPVTGIRNVGVAFRMKNMDMGRNRYRLQRTASGYTGRAVLPVCTTGRTDWLAEVQVETADNRYVAQFAFEVSR